MNPRTVVLLAVLAGLPACSLSQEYPDTKQYAFEVRRTSPPREPAPGTRLMVSRFDISRRYEGRQMVYRLGDGTWEADFYHRFLIPPAEMIAEEATRWFVAARATEAVLEPSSFVDATHAIEGTVVGLYGDYSGADGPHAVLEMQLFAVGRGDGLEPSILVSAEYGKRVPLADRGSDALVAGWERALGEILAEFEERLAKALASEDRD